MFLFYTLDICCFGILKVSVMKSGLALVDIVVSARLRFIPWIPQISIATEI